MGLNGFFIVWNLPLLRIFNFIQFKSLEKQKEYTGPNTKVIHTFYEKTPSLKLLINNISIGFSAVQHFSELTKTKNA